MGRYILDTVGDAAATFQESECAVLGGGAIWKRRLSCENSSNAYKNVAVKQNEKKPRLLQRDRFVKKKKKIDFRST